MSKNKLADMVKNKEESIAMFANLIGADTPYFAALGRFISQYALAEAGAHLLARHLSGMPDETARIIFGGMRLKDLAERIRQMMRARNGEDESYNDADACLRQLDEITKQRKKLAHRFAEYDTDALHVTDALTAKNLAAAERDVFRMADLQAMLADCSVIYIRLVYLKEPRVKDSLAESNPELYAYQYGPWRYTPARPETRKKQRLKARQARQRQPDASQK